MSQERVVWVAEVADRETLTRLIRAALLHQAADVPLARPPAEPGRQTLQLCLQGAPIAVIGAAREGNGGGSPFRLWLSPLDPSHIPALAALIEQPSSIRAGRPFAATIPDSEPAFATGTEVDPAPLTVVEQERTLEVLPSSGAAYVDDAPTRPGSEPKPPAAPPGVAGEPPSSDGPAPSAVSSGATSSGRYGPRTQRRKTGEMIVAGRVIANRYRIEGLVGAGAVGAVYRASHVELPRMFALKVLHPTCRRDPQLMASFRAEARAASLLDHANITVVHDFGEDPDGLVYIVMEFLEGTNLQAVLDENRRLEPRRAIAIMLQVCAALAVAHERGIVHRDVKPDNIMLVRTRDDDGGEVERAKVCDFGIAALESAPDAAGAEITAGTPEYMAPEQAAGRADARTDVYACGVVLYEMLVGRPPFVAETPVGTLAKQANEAPTPPSELVDGVPPELEAIILRALEKDPARRPSTMRELRADLKRLLG